MNLNAFAVGALLIVFALMVVITVATDEFVTDDIRPANKYTMLLISALLSGLCAGLLMEKLGLRLTNY